MLSHNASAFGAPFCGCTDGDACKKMATCVECENLDGDDDDAVGSVDSDLYNFTMDPRSHYGGTSFEESCKDCPESASYTSPDRGATSIAV